ncbi:unnamed protein product [Brachionus calyciflorus]|uniref:Uncharacterized protein n=1 Tax=Brachionus calyciflorus TaxID=104777 RepID=A0A814F7Z3_9BILA|nr:unnamed protein product [Brachionus calyciflorus]
MNLQVWIYFFLAISVVNGASFGELDTLNFKNLDQEIGRSLFTNLTNSSESSSSFFGIIMNLLVSIFKFIVG